MKLFMIWVDNDRKYDDHEDHIYRCFLVPDDTNTSGLILKFPNLAKNDMNKSYIDNFCQWLEKDMGFASIPMGEGHTFKVTTKEFYNCINDLSYVRE